ncbi:MAG: response regulator [Deltaproteobacteria bacterium]|jgi:DNA-binding NtrC family response regulator|nr:response regulator [Deltaproteobacteria bacterium]
MHDQEPASILIVDDEPSILKMLEGEISYHGYKTIAAPHAKAACQLAEKQPKIDLLITDIIMPGMNGIDLAREITSLHPDIRIVFMSGHYNPSVFEKSLPEKNYDFMVKPFGLDTLMNTIRNALAFPDVP